MCWWGLRRMKDYDIQLLRISKDNRREATAYDIMLVGAFGGQFFKVPVSNSQEKDTRELYKKLQEMVKLQEELGLDD